MVRECLSEMKVCFEACEAAQDRLLAAVGAHYQTLGQGQQGTHWAVVARQVCENDVISRKSRCYTQKTSLLIRVDNIVDMTADRRGSTLPDARAGTAGHALGSRRAAGE
jgi:hypothetical protein